MTYAHITKGKHTGKIARIKKGNLDETILQYPDGWYREADEYSLAKELIDSMSNARLNYVLPKYVSSSDASQLISKYMRELGQREFQGGCCG